MFRNIYSNKLKKKSITAGKKISFPANAKKNFKKLSKNNKITMKKL